MHHACCASCHVHVSCVYYVVCFFPVLLLRVGSDNVAFVRIRSSLSACLLHGLVLLPCGISGKMTTPRNHFYLCYASCSLYCHAPLPITCYIMSPISAMSAPNHPFLANRCLAKLPLLLSLLIALLVAGEVEVCSMSEHGYVGISQYLLFN